MFGKWELVETDKVMIEEIYYPMWMEVRTKRVICDMYRKKKWNGIYKYKYVRK